MKRFFSFAVAIIGLYTCLNFSSCSNDDKDVNIIKKENHFRMSFSENFDNESDLLYLNFDGENRESKFYISSTYSWYIEADDENLYTFKPNNFKNVWDGDLKTKEVEVYFKGFLDNTTLVFIRDSSTDDIIGSLYMRAENLGLLFQPDYYSQHLKYKSEGGTQIGYIVSNQEITNYTYEMTNSAKGTFHIKATDAKWEYDPYWEQILYRISFEIYCSPGSDVEGGSLNVFYEDKMASIGLYRERE